MANMMYDFKPAGTGAPVEERVAVALEFIAKMLGAQTGLMITQGGKKP